MSYGYTSYIDGFGSFSRALIQNEVMFSEAVATPPRGKCGKLKTYGGRFGGRTFDSLSIDVIKSLPSGVGGWCCGGWRESGQFCAGFTVPPPHIDS